MGIYSGSLPRPSWLVGEGGKGGTWTARLASKLNLFLLARLSLSRLREILASIQWGVHLSLAAESHTSREATIIAKFESYSGEKRLS